ncbi:hypothetical protein BU15DRAFT_69344 [Melanogaster broomeanus]|nr:hypothetical protein BU15DRAFT_69344 [Melanogaster broomeanus]
MEKVQQLWTPQSITTTFTFPPQSELPTANINGLTKVSTICTRSCGPGWNLVLTKTKTKPKNRVTYTLEFRVQSTHPSLEAKVVNVQTTLSRSGEGAIHFPERQITLRDAPPSEAITPLWSSNDLDEISNAYLILMITTVTGSNEPCNLLDLACSSFAPSSPPPYPSSTVTSSSALRVLGQSIGDGVSFDTKFLANSKRLSLGSLYEPLPTYANMAILEEVCPKLNTLFPSGFTSIAEGDLPLPVLEDYDYSCDSDIGDDDGVVEDGGNVVPAEVETSDHPEDTGSSAASVMDTRSAVDLCCPDMVGQTGSNRGETVRSPSSSADSMADSEIIESAISAQHCRHDADVELVQVKCAAHRTPGSFQSHQITDSSDHSSASRRESAFLFAEVHVPPGG